MVALKALQTLKTEAYLIHTYRIGETRALLVFFTHEYGKIKAFARIQKKNQGLLRPLLPLWIELSEKKKHFNLVGAEPAAAGTIALPSCNQRLLGAFHLNELLLFYFEEQLPDPPLYQTYRKALSAIEVAEDFPALVCVFEYQLLEAIGYAPLFPTSIDPQRTYYFHPAYGCSDSLLQEEASLTLSSVVQLPGSALMKLREQDFSTAGVRKLGKKLFELQLHWHAAPHKGFSRQLAQLWKEALSSTINPENATGDKGWTRRWNH